MDRRGILERCIRRPLSRKRAKEADGSHGGRMSLKVLIPSPRTIQRAPGRASSVWRRGWDSNPRSLTGQRFSRPPDSAALAPLRIRNLTGVSCSCHAFIARDPFRLRGSVVKSVVQCFPDPAHGFRFLTRPDMSVALNHRKIRPSSQFLNRPQIHSGLNQAAREGMAQRV